MTSKYAITHAVFCAYLKIDIEINVFIGVKTLFIADRVLFFVNHRRVLMYIKETECKKCHHPLPHRRHNVFIEFLEKFRKS